MIEIIDPSILSTIQGKAYRGTRHLGMPLSGAADPITMAVANRLAHNDYDAASIEFSLMGGTLKALKTTMLGIAGPVKEIRLNDIICDHQQSIIMSKGDILSITISQQGAHIYVAIRGGFKADQYWQGNSTFLPANIGGFKGNILSKGDILESEEPDCGIADIKILPERYRMKYNNQHVLRIGAINEFLIHDLVHHHWTVGRQGNRIGYILDGPIIAAPHNQNTKSQAVFPGIIQCPPSGKPFLLGPDAQTTGGYPIIAHVIRADRHIIGQIKSGDTIQFIPNKPHEARRVYINKLNLWRKFIPNLRLD